MMIRIFCSNKTYESELPLVSQSAAKQMKRIEGGWWFSEETLDGQRQTYKCINKINLQDNFYIEILSDLHPDFIEQPCWPHESLETWIPVRSEELTVLWKMQDQLVLTFPIEQRWLPWMEQLLGSDCTTIQEVLLANKTRGLETQILPPQLSRDSIHPEKLVQPTLKQRAKSPLQMKKQLLPSYETHRAGPRVSPQASQSTLSEDRVQQHPRQVLVSVPPKAVQSGSLCSPTLLPESPLPRKLPSRQPKHHRHIESTLVNAPEQSACLIDLSVT